MKQENNHLCSNYTKNINKLFTLEMMSILKRSKKYSATLMGNLLLFFETKVVASLVVQGISEADIKVQVREENLFQYKTTKSIKKRLGEIFKRLRAIDVRLIDVLVNSSSNEGKLICYYAVLKTDLLFAEFVNEVVLEKVRLKQNFITNSEIEGFFTHKAEQSSDVASWTEYTVKKLISAYKSVLRDAGLIKGTKNPEILVQVLPGALADILIELGERAYISLLLGD